MQRLGGGITSTVALALMLGGAMSCQKSGPTSTPQAAVARPAVVPPSPTTTRPANYPGLHNVVAYGEAFYSGSVPEGDEGFETLTRMGIKTVISVDGATPDVDSAKKHGMRYVHLPIGYNGMDEERKLELSRAVRDLPGPIYLHCHHGKHRSAGAAGAVAVTLGRMSPEEAVARMKVSDTSPEYKGLFLCVASARSDVDGVGKASNAFPQIYKTSGLVNAMVEIDEAFDHLKLIEKAGWKPPADHPDLVPAAEAGKLADHYRNLDGDKDVKDKPAEFGRWIANEYTLAATLEEGLANRSMTPAALSAQFKKVFAVVHGLSRQVSE